MAKNVTRNDNKHNAKNDKNCFGIKKYLFKYKYQLFLYLLFLFLTFGVGTVFSVIIVAKAIEFVALGEFSKSILALMFELALILFQYLFWFFMNKIKYKYSNKITYDISCDLSKQCFKLNSNTYSNHSTGSIVQRVVDDPKYAINDLFIFAAVSIDFFVGIIITIYLMFLNIYTAIALFLLMIICFSFEIYRVIILNRNMKIVNTEFDNVHSFTTEIVKSEKDIKSLNISNNLNNITKENFNNYANADYKKEFMNTNIHDFMRLFLEIGFACVLILGIYLLDLGLITLATFMLIYKYNNANIAAVYSGSDCANFLADYRRRVLRMSELFNEKDYVCENFGNTQLDKVKGDISFQNIKFGFDDWGDDTKRHRKKYIFKDLSFDIKAHTTVAFVGKSGSGKTTILNLMSKMLVADAGKILIDKIDINKLSKTTLRNSISLVNQFPYIFDMTIKDNLLLVNNSATDEELWNALERASLKDFVKKLPKKLDTIVGEGGIKLSGGQKQRLAICRALLRKSPIIIFDESTSSLDNFAQNDIKETIDNLKGESTIIIVAHRLSTIKDVDKIFFLEDGKITSEGTFQELFMRNDNFKDMFYIENI